MREDQYARLLRLLIELRAENGVSLREAAGRMPSQRPLSHTSIGDRLSGRYPVKDVGELDALVVAFGGSREHRDRARRLFPSTSPQRKADTVRSAPKDRAPIRRLLDELLPASQLAAGNGDMLAEVATDELEPGEVLVLLYPCRSARSAGGSAVLIVTDRDVVLVELVGNGVAGSRRRRPRSAVRQVPLESRRSLHLRKADLTIRWSDDTEWHCRSLRREQATVVADLLRPSVGPQRRAPRPYPG